MEIQGVYSSQTLTEKKKVEDLHYLFQDLVKATLIKTGWYLPEDRQIDKSNRREREQN